MPSSFEIIKLKGVSLSDSPHLRRHVRSEARWSDHYLERYDRTTLFYDCFYQPQKGCYIVTAPRFLNLWPLVSKHLYVNDQRHSGRLKRQTWQRCEQVEIYAPAAAELSIQADQLHAKVTVRETLQALFSNLNVAMAISKNNQLDWIRDWVTYHINAHGLEGVCIIDNDSTDYSNAELLDTLRNIHGLKAATVIAAPFSYGPSNASRKLEISPRFLQTSMFNLVKRDMFNKARAILSVDIDELVVPNSKQSVFDYAVNSKMGAVSFREIKVYPQGNEEKAYPQFSHTLTKKNFKFGNTKWCVKGNGFMNRFGWAVHRFGGGFFPFTESTKFNYLHCHATSTSWKKNRYKKIENLEQNETVRSALEKFLPRTNETSKN